MAFNQFMFGSPSRYEKIDKFTPETSSVINQLRDMAFGGLQKNKPDFAPIEQQYKQQFQQETIPNLAERFTSMGGGQRSSAFQGSLGRAGVDLNTNLAALRSKFDMQNRGQLMQMLGMGLTPQQDTGFFQSKPGFLGAAAPGVGAGLGELLPLLAKAGIGGLAGGPVGAGAAVAPDALNALMKILGIFGGRSQQQQGNQGVTYSNQIPNNNLA